VEAMGVEVRALGEGVERVMGMEVRASGEGVR
jgi:hypothetical protein